MWPEDVFCVGEVSNNDPEVTKEVQTCNVVNIAEQEDGVMNRLITRCSDWKKLKKSVAWLLLFKLWKLRKKMEEPELVKPFETCKMTVNEMDMVEHEMIKFAQMESFGEDIRLIKTKGIISHSSSIRMFDPILVQDLLCRGGRLKNIPVEVSVAMNTIILPKHHHVVELIVRHCHGISGHSSGRCFSLMLWSFSSTSKSAELTLSSDLALERVAILKNLASETVPPVKLSKLEMMDTAENN